MRVFLGVLLLMSALAYTCSAQFVPCKDGKLSTVGHAEGITFQRISFVERDTEIGASVFIPDSKEPVPGIVFSHSAIHGVKNQTDLTRFALAMARAGAASIVLDGTIEWQAPNDGSKRPPHVMACAGQWLLLNANLDKERLAVAGVLGPWGGGDPPICQPGERPCWHPKLWINFGQSSPVELVNTDAMLTLGGQLRMARSAQRHLRLAEVQPSWLAAEPDN